MEKIKYINSLILQIELIKKMFACIEELIEGGACEGTICQTNYKKAEKIIQQANDFLKDK
jgi:hypothetical protein